MTPSPPSPEGERDDLLDQLRAAIDAVVIKTTLAGEQKSETLTDAINKALGWGGFSIVLTMAARDSIARALLRASAPPDGRVREALRELVLANQAVAEARLKTKRRQYHDAPEQQGNKYRAAQWLEGALADAIAALSPSSDAGQGDSSPHKEQT